MDFDHHFQTDQPRDTSLGCILTGLYAGTAFWIVVTSLIALIGGWVVEQGMFEGSAQIGNIRWLISLAYAASLLFPLALILAILRQRVYNRVYFGWLLASSLAVLTVPARLTGITDSQTASVFQIGALLLYLFVLHRFGALGVSGQTNWTWRGQKPGLGLALLSAAALAVPWFLWGAAGSPLDLILNVFTGFLFALASIWTLQLGALNSLDDKQSMQSGQVVLKGFSALLNLLILVTAFAQNGSQVLLALCVPLLGWSLAALHRTEGKSAPWLPATLLLGVVVSMILAFIDPDELSLVISSGPGELLNWALRAAGFTTFLVVGISILFLIFSNRRSLVEHRWWLPAAVVTWVTAFALYGLFGQPGFFGERLFVILADQADVSHAVEIEDIDERRAYVYDTLTNHAISSQAALYRSLDRFGVNYQPYYLVNALEVNGGPLVKAWLSAHPDVDHVIPSPRLRPLPAQLEISTGTITTPQPDLWNLELIGAERVKTELQISGQGIVIGHGDSGVQADHPEFSDGYVGRVAVSAYGWYDPWFDSEDPIDYGGHGTHTLGIILGNTTGVAPDAEWMACSNLSRNLGNPALYLDCLQFFLAPFPYHGDPFIDGDPSEAADVLNNSWGCPPTEGCDPDSLRPAFEVLRYAGIFVVVSAGNSGLDGCGTVEDPPAIYDSVYSIGAVNQLGELADFSSRGPVTIDGSRIVKPDLLAPGVEVFSSYPGGSYASLSGTSMAGPHAAGVVALMWSANPSLIGNIDATETILNSTAESYLGLPPVCASGANLPKNGIGYGLIDAYEAVKAALIFSPAD